MAKPLSIRFWVFVLIGIFVFGLVRTFVHYGPNDAGAGRFTYNLVGNKYGFPQSTYVGSGTGPLRIRLAWSIVAYKEDADKKGGVYTVRFLHMTLSPLPQGGSTPTSVQGDVICHYQVEGRVFSLLGLRIYALPGAK